MNDEHVIVIGGDESAPSETPPPRRSPLLVLFLGMALVVALVAFVAAPSERVPTTADVSDLQPPPEPTTVPQATLPPKAPVEVPELAVGWHEVQLVGQSWAINSVDHGPGGWLAVAEGPSPVAHVSEDAEMWVAHTITGLAGGDLKAAVGDGVMAVVGAFAGFGPIIGDVANTAVSRDGGETWTTTALDERPIALVDVAALGPDVFAFGQIAEGGVPDSNQSVGAIWRLGGGGWEEIGFDQPPGSGVTSVVEGPDASVWAFGYTPDGPAAWMVVDDALHSVDLALPDEGPFRAFASVQSDGSGQFRGLLGSPRDGALADTIWSSEDLSTWEPYYRGSRLSMVAVAPAGVVLAANSRVGQIVALTDGETQVVGSSYPGVETGWEGMAEVLDIEAADDRIVMVGYGNAGVHMVVRGTDVAPISIAGGFQPGEPRWLEVTSADDPGASRFVSVQGGVRSGEDLFIATDTQVWRVEDIDGDTPTLTKALPNPVGIGGGPFGVWATSQSGSGSTLFDYHGNGVWASSPVPLDQIAAVGEVEGVPTIFGWENGITNGARLDGAGRWVSFDLGPLPPDVVVAVEQGFFGERFSGDTAVALYSADGVEWQPVPGELNYWWGGGIPYLVEDEDRSVVTLVDRWPEVEEVTLPTAAVHSVLRDGERLWAMATGGLVFMRDPGEAWREIPIDLEHGVEGEFIIVGGGEPTLAIISRGELRLLQLRP